MRAYVCKSAENEDPMMVKVLRRGRVKPWDIRILGWQNE